MNDVTTVILADLVNLISHINIFQHKNHDSSCLICYSNKASHHSKRRRKFHTNFCTVPTSSDLMLLNSGTSANETRQLVFMDTKLDHKHEERAFQRELQTYLHFDVANGLFTPPPKTIFATLVFVISPSSLSLTSIHNWLDKHQSRKLFLIVPKEQETNFSFEKIKFKLSYDNYETTLKMLTHISLIKKQRIRIKDLVHWFGSSFQCLSSVDECVFI